MMAPRSSVSHPALCITNGILCVHRSDLRLPVNLHIYYTDIVYIQIYMYIIQIARILLCNLHLMIFAIIQQKYFSCWAIYLWNWTYAATSLFHIWPLSHDYQSNDSHDHYWSVNCQLSYFMLFPIESSHFVWRHILSRLTFKDCHVSFPGSGYCWLHLAAGRKENLGWRGRLGKVEGGKVEGWGRWKVERWKAGEGGRLWGEVSRSSDTSHLWHPRVNLTTQNVRTKSNNCSAHRSISKSNTALGKCLKNSLARPLLLLDKILLGVNDTDPVFLWPSSNTTDLRVKHGLILTVSLDNCNSAVGACVVAWILSKQLQRFVGTLGNMATWHTRL